MPLSHFAFYPSNFLGSVAVRSMSLEARGAYFTLLCVMSGMPGCLMPNDDAALAKAVGCRIDVWRRLRKEIEPALTIVGGTVTQDRLALEVQKAERAYAKAVKAQKVGLKSEKTPTKVGEKSDFLECNSAESNETGVSQATANKNKNKKKTLIASEDRSPETPPAKPRAKPHPDHSRFVAFFDGLFLEATGSKPTWGPKQGHWVKQLLSAHGFDTCAERARVLLRGHGPPWIESRDLGTLVQHFDKLAPVRPVVAAPAGYRLETVPKKSSDPEGDTMPTSGRYVLPSEPKRREMRA